MWLLGFNKSRYIDDISNDKSTEKFIFWVKRNLEVSRYGDLIYDKYRDVYCRFVYPNISLDNNVQWRGKSVYLRKSISISILDNKLNIIGETLFPESIYNSYVFFIYIEGLYVNHDYKMNYKQSENYMTFELFYLNKVSSTIVRQCHLLHSILFIS